MFPDTYITGLGCIQYAFGKPVASDLFNVITEKGHIRETPSNCQLIIT